MKPSTAILYRPDSKGCRWVDNVNDGLRFVGKSSDVAKTLRHTGWYTNDFGDMVHGAVWQLPARHGAPQYVGGSLDPNMEGSALICFSDITDDPITAAMWGDHMAERMAGESRQAEEAFQNEINALEAERLAELDEQERVA